MRIKKASYSNGKITHITLCDECGAEADYSSPSPGMWFLDCGHHLCSGCDEYGKQHRKRAHEDSCPGWKVGMAPDKFKDIQVDLQRRGYTSVH